MQNLVAAKNKNALEKKIFKLLTETINILGASRSKLAPSYHTFDYCVVGQMPESILFLYFHLSEYCAKWIERDNINFLPLPVSYIRKVSHSVSAPCDNVDIAWPIYFLWRLFIYLGLICSSSWSFTLGETVCHSAFLLSKTDFTDLAEHKWEKVCKM